MQAVKPDLLHPRARIAKCAQCGAEFMKYHGQHKYCQPCGRWRQSSLSRYKPVETRKRRIESKRVRKPWTPEMWARLEAALATDYGMDLFNGLRAGKVVAQSYGSKKERL